MIFDVTSAFKPCQSGEERECSSIDLALPIRYERGLVHRSKRRLQPEFGKIDA
jgi:hypothetical protein